MADEVVFANNEAVVTIGENTYFFEPEVIEREVDTAKSEDVAAEQVPTLEIVHMNDQLSCFSVPKGIKFDATRRMLIFHDPRIGDGPVSVPLDNVKYWTVRK
jgi:hypothetical protein